MGFVTDNDLVDGVSGRVGSKIVYRTVKGITLATRRPKPYATSTEKQIEHRETFKLATEFARRIMLDPAAKEEYKKMAGNKPFHNAFSEAVRDYFTPPVIKSVDVSEYNGSAGSALPIRVAGFNKIVSINVTITDASNNVIETGEAYSIPGEIDWKYFTLNEIAIVPGLKITIVAKDRPGQKATLEHVF